MKWTVGWRERQRERAYPVSDRERINKIQRNFDAKTEKQRRTVVRQFLPQTAMESPPAANNCIIIDRPTVNRYFNRGNWGFNFWRHFLFTEVMCRRKADRNARLCVCLENASVHRKQEARRVVLKHLWFSMNKFHYTVCGSNSDILRLLFNILVCVINAQPNGVLKRSYLLVTWEYFIRFPFLEDIFV